MSLPGRIRGNRPKFSSDPSSVSVTICESPQRAQLTPSSPIYRNFSYAPALRPLRPFARIVRFKKAQPSLIVNRLRQICDKERVKADTRGLTRLAEMTNSDVRSCLNTLQVSVRATYYQALSLSTFCPPQFMKSRSLEITEKTLRQSSIGMKDSGASLNVVWHNLFVPVSTKGKRKENGVGKDSYVNRLAFEVQSCGDQDKVVQGQSFSSQKFIDV
jgi:chromosome transmission fidelity protein 18